MTKVLVDVTPAYDTKMTGVSNFAQLVYEQLLRAPDLEVSGYAFTNKSAKNQSTTVINQLYKKMVNYPRYFGIEIPLKIFVNPAVYDIVIGTNYLLPPCGSTKSIVTVHDLCFYDHPEWVENRNAHILKKMLPRSLARSSAAIAVSQFTAQRIREVYNYQKPIYVISMPPANHPTTTSVPGALKGCPENYFLFVSTIEPRKNVQTLLDAYDSLPAEVQQRNHLVLAGKQGWDGDALRRLSSTKNKNVHYIGYVSNEERAWLYEHSLATVIPSFYEGYGMMALEALSWNTPVITSNIPPQMELLGDAGMYFEPDDHITLSDHLSAITSKSTRNATLEQQTKAVSNHTWDKLRVGLTEFILQIARSS